MPSTQPVRFIPATGNRPPVKPLPPLPPPAEAPTRTRGAQTPEYFGSIGSTGSARKPFALDFSKVRDAGVDFDPAVAAAQSWATQLSSARNPTSAVGVYQTKRGALLLVPAYQYQPDQPKARTGIPALDTKHNVRPNDSNTGLLALVSPATWSDLRLGKGLSHEALRTVGASGARTMKDAAKANEALSQLQSLGAEKPTATWAKRYSAALDASGDAFVSLAAQARQFVKVAQATAGYDSAVKESLIGMSDRAQRLVGLSKEISAYDDFGNVSRLPQEMLEQGQRIVRGIDPQVKQILARLEDVPAKGD